MYDFVIPINELAATNIEQMRLPSNKKSKYSSFTNKNGELEEYFQPAIFCDTSFLLDYWNSDDFNQGYLKDFITKLNGPDKLKEILTKYFDPLKRERSLFQLRQIVENYQTKFNFIYSPACRYELEEIISRTRFKNFATQKHENISVVEKKSIKEIGKIIRNIKLDLINDSDNQFLQELYFEFFRTTSNIHDGLSGFIEADIIKLKFTKKDFSWLHEYANQQMGLADMIHLMTAKNLKCRYFFTFDSDFENCKDEIKAQFNIEVFTKIDEMINLIKN